VAYPCHGSRVANDSVAHPVSRPVPFGNLTKLLFGVGLLVTIRFSVPLPQCQCAGAVAEFFHGRAHLVEHRDVEIAERRAFGVGVALRK
jgi:hydrogenase/urease accessory protein HupE